MTIYLGVDPGISGGFARIDHTGIKSVHSMPPTEREIYKLVSSISKQDVKCCIETIPHSIFGIGKTSMSKLYGNYAATRMALVCCEIPFTEVWAKDWQKFLNITKKPKEAQNLWKDRLRAKAQNLFPKFNWDDYGLGMQRSFSDAVLIAHYCRLVNVHHIVK